jgi:hypothetical protein
MHLPSGCCAAFRLWSLGKQRWFKFNGTVLDHFNAAILTGVFRGIPGTPPAWLKPARKQLPLTELERRCTITWNVPRAELQQLLAAGSLERRASDKVYMAGTGVQLLLRSKKVEGKTSYGVFLTVVDYAQDGFTLCSARLGMSCHVTIWRHVPGQELLSVVLLDTATLTSRGWGKTSYITASTPADLEPYLADGHLKLEATIRLIPG